MTDTYTPVLTEEQVSKILGDFGAGEGSDNEYEVARAIERAAIEAYRHKHPDLIRIDICWPNGTPDVEYITHDECRKRLAAFGDSHRQLMELKRIFSAVENAGPTS